MKNIILILCAAGFFLFGVLPVQAGVAVGATTWYTGWKNSPSFYDKANPFLLYGPVFSVDVADKWSVAGVFLAGELTWKQGGQTLYERRYDNDLTINYNYSRYLKFFGGAKYMYYTWKHKPGSIPLFSEGDGDHYAAGPALGIGITLPVTESLFTIINVSGLYAFGKQSELANSTLKNTSVNDIGINSSIALAYYIDAINSTISVGGRFQYLGLNYPGHSEFNSKTYFYGVTLTLTYHFATE